jgi:hypothetical protein
MTIVVSQMLNVEVLWEVVTQVNMSPHTTKRYPVIIIRVRMNNAVKQMLNADNLMIAFIPVSTMNIFRIPIKHVMLKIVPMMNVVCSSLLVVPILVPHFIFNT